MRTVVCLLVPLLLLLLGRAGAADDDDDDDGEPSSPAQQAAADVSPMPLADMASGAAQALFGAAGPLPQGRCARADWVDCGTEGDGNAPAWCAPLLKEHFHAAARSSRWPGHASSGTALDVNGSEETPQAASSPGGAATR